MNIASTFNLATAPVTAEVVRPCIPRDRVNFIDPFAPDSPADQMVVTTERRLLRLSILAAEAALRMKRDGSRSGVESWLLEPLTLFENRRALDAGQELIPFMRGVLFNGLTIGSDIDPEVMDELIGEHGFADEEEPRAETPTYHEVGTRGARLFTCYIDGPSGTSGRRVRAIWALISSTEANVRKRLALRFGEAVANEAEVVQGFEPCHPALETMLSDELVELLTHAMLDPERAAASEFEFYTDLRRML